ncbi:metal-dependent hydrolase [Candidimonas sp. SYP-B2681]|uniref:metal-dependent hydrolase n=1 Tax=Candidimonas sp. SYP-B2681 TaxID=2497686 RepID=UPI000F86D5A6|nr:metal-dependent hydrolase [Candidimonas sp. SYP-B2681]RTZ48150.1 metal-dependent hydrolase [Candidimonas sp. SYP-B2681]
MDSLTQAVLGAGISGSMLGHRHGRKALIAGALLATLPDLDVFIDYGDPLAAMINHRGFSHSLLVLTALTALIGWGAKRCQSAHGYKDERLYLTIWLVLITHPLLDAFTSYGTQLWWPWKPTPSSWSSIFVIDPFFTLPLSCAVLASLIWGPHARLRRVLACTLAFCALYLAISVAVKSHIESRIYKQLAENGVKTQNMFSTPEPFNIFLWRVVAKTTDDHYYETIASLFDRGPAETILLPLNSDLIETMSANASLNGLKWFTGNWLRFDEINGQLVVSDLRMGLGTGFYAFRFLLAERTEPDGAWQPLKPRYWLPDRDTSELWTTIKRIWSQTPPIPLNKWEQRMHIPH